jgi:dTDP-4-dehydrorhamnose 3,5-epimerase-like enzyme
MTSTADRPRLIEGGLHVDVRGSIAFVNDFDFEGVDRFYIVRSHKPYELRGWVGHRREQKWFFVVQGTSLIAVVKPDRWQSPASDLPVERFTLSAAKPQILCVPPGYATGSTNLAGDAVVLIFSSGKIEDAKADDYRFPVDTWSIVE